MPTNRELELIDWSERHPEESSVQIAIRQSTFCPCGRAKQIGEPNCGAAYHMLAEDDLEQDRRAGKRE